VPFFEQRGKSKMMEAAGIVTREGTKQSRDFLQISALLFRKANLVLASAAIGRRGCFGLA
jgi:hypothetical protein